MPRHEDMDYPHNPLWCDECHAAHIAGQRHRELVEAMERSTGVEKIEVTRQFIPTPKKTKEQQSKGGISLEPRRKDIG